jgi:MFS family permease
MTDQPSSDPSESPPASTTAATASTAKNVHDNAGEHTTQTGASVAITFGWVSFFQDLGSKMLVPIVPLFLTATLGAPPAVVGLVDGVGDATASVTSAAAGRVATHRRALRLVRLGYALSSFSKLLMAIAPNWAAVLGLRFTDRVGKGVRDAPRDALVIASAGDRLGRALGIQQAMDKAGGFLGPLIGVAALELADGEFRPVFAVAFVPCLISVVMLRRARSLQHVVVPEPKTRDRVPLGRPARSILAVMVIGALSRVPDGLLLIRAVDLGASATTVLLAFSLMRLTNALAAYPAGRLSDRISSRRLVGLSFGLVAIAQAVTAGFDTSVALWPALALLGVADALWRAPAKAWMSRSVEPAQRATALGDMQAGKGIAGLIAGVAAGLAWGASGTLPISVGAVLAAAVAVWVVAGGAETAGLSG